MDLGNVDAWRIMMCLRSGLLSETTYALDALNVLLFDDTTVPYFGLAQWPGLLDLLLEHFRKSLGDMFDIPTLQEPNRDWYETDACEPTRVDLGAVHKDSIDSDEKTVLLLNTPNFTQLSRKEQPVKLVEKNEDIFIRDNHKDWDQDGDAAGVNVTTGVTTDPWQLGNVEPTPTKYILPCFQSEFNNIPFCKLIDEEDKSSKVTAAAADNQQKIKVEPNDGSYSVSSSESVNVIETQLRGNVLKNRDKKKRTKTLSDVISRITNDSSELNVLLTQELKEKVKTDSNGMKISDDIDLSPEMNQNGPSVGNKTKTEPVDSEEDTTNGSGASGSNSNECVLASNAKLNIRDEASILKRRRMSDYEDECYTRDEASLCLITESQDAIARRCVCISNILRNLTFIPGNEAEFAKSPTFLSLLGKLLLLHHEHPVRTQKTRNYDREEDADFVDSCSSLQGESEWWWDFLVHIRENVLVSASNIAGHMDLSLYAEEVARPVLDGLLHWAICPSAHGQDPFPSVGAASLLSPQRLALETLCKMCVTDSNVDLVIATPPFSRLERLCAVLTKHLCRSEDQVLREFSVNLLHYLAAADSAMARVVAMQSPCVSLLVAFIEQAEQSALGVANQHGIGALRENPDSMGTSLDMLRRAAGTLLHLAKHPDNRPLFMQQEQRLLQLVMSQILDQQVAYVIARVLFHISRTNENSSSTSNS